MSGLSAPIRLLAGLGNPGADYTATRHNAGWWWLNQVAEAHHVTLRPEKKFHGHYGSFTYHNQRIHLLLPTTFMNASGQAVSALCQFYDVTPQQILVAHDDLDLATGDIRLKFAGGHGGHNGLRDIIAHLSSKDFYRLRIGIGHPGQREQVLNYVLSAPGKRERVLLDERLQHTLALLPDLLEGKIAQAMQVLHTASAGQK